MEVLEVLDLFGFVLESLPALEDFGIFVCNVLGWLSFGLEHWPDSFYCLVGGNLLFLVVGVFDMTCLAVDGYGIISFSFFNWFFGWTTG